MSHPASTLRPVRRNLAMCVVFVLCLASGANAQATIDLMALNGGKPGDALPKGWAVRAVRGQQAPSSSIVDSAGLRYLRIAGTSRAAWFLHELRMPLPVGGQLSWRWRVPVTPVGANLSAASTDDAALRVFVVFARRGLFETTPRALFYSLADGSPPSVATGRRRKPLASLVAGLPAATLSWVTVTADPIADYRRLWQTDAPRIVAIGVMQDTDQTRSAAVGDLFDLKWSTPDVTPP